MPTNETDIAALLEAYAATIALSAERYVSAAIGEDIAPAIKALTDAEQAMRDMGLSQADIYSWVNRTAAPTEV